MKIDEVRMPSFQERREIEDRARQLRAEAMTAGMKMLFRAIAQLPQWIGQKLRVPARA